MYEGNISDTNHKGNFKAEKKLYVKEKCFIRIQTEDPVIAFTTRCAVTVPLNKPEKFTGFEIGFVNGINNTL